MPEDKSDKKRVAFTVLYGVIAVALVLGAQWLVATDVTTQTVPYSELLRMVRADEVEKIDLRSGEIVAQTKQKKLVQTSRLPGIDESPLMKDLEDHHVAFSGTIEGPSMWHYALAWGIPMLILAAPWLVGMRMMRRAGGPLSVGKNKAKVYDATQETRVTFEDVAGVDEAKAELVEIVDYLKHPARYQSLGARIPKGVLLVGPPGTGKTLLAKAIAGEAAVPFFSLSASAFIEMFVGVGAARVRDLFEQAKLRAPCIVFIDELDAIGRSRAGAVAVAHEEREQTLNQLLVEMDGFDAGGGVIIVAACNRPEVLDPALLRPGRFDREVVVDRPDVRGREAILTVHARKVALAPDVDLSVVAKMTPGMVGADLANVVNEAALAAARRSAPAVEQRDVVSAVDRMQLGLEKKGTVMTPEEKRRVAIHESGHTLVALSMASADPVHRVTIIPRSIGALGATLQLPTDDKRLLTVTELRDRVCVMLGGRTAEMLLLGEPSTGAQNDLERASETARAMACRFGMSDRLGPMTFGRATTLRFLGETTEERNYSEETARAIDVEVRRIIDEENARARNVLSKRRATLRAISEALLVKETLSREELDEIVAKADEEIEDEEGLSIRARARSPRQASRP